VIVKVQLSLCTSEAERQVLIYDKARRLHVTLPVSACLGLEEEMSSEFRAFFKADVKDDKVHLGRRLPEQGW
jgi:hypothetical protein